LILDLKQLKKLSELKYQHSQQELSSVLRREAELRYELKRMRGLLQKTQAQDPEDAQLRAIGGDIIWLKWVGQVQRELNIALAGVLGQKEALMARHRQASGRKLVAEDLADQHEQSLRRVKNIGKLQSVIDSSLLRSLDKD